METNSSGAPSHSLIPFNDQYVRELGVATYIFSYLEWGIVWSIECLEHGYINMASKGTAGAIADKFKSVASRSTVLPANIMVEIQMAADKFKALVTDRNMLIHGNPYTAVTGSQQLLYNGKSGWREWSITDIQAVAAEFETLAIEVNRLFRAHLWALRS
ncbi:hypothetical protein SAMN04515618_12025 [Collimonas sp. OK307]|uniref:hypothetical protein n=1 Tax=Collimonas sp. OK307 TaxID=1801620 RepID=UPI0008E3EF68|nr:hypothetical protein [Collimonas sp. OK307]SFI37681.1 hypothetical protein SAMN04515618_12025 [Collimonas sp. OK307]